MARWERWGPTAVSVIALVLVLAYAAAHNRELGKRDAEVLSKIARLEGLLSATIATSGEHSDSIRMWQAYVFRLTNEMVAAGVKIPEPPKELEVKDGNEE